MFIRVLVAGVFAFLVAAPGVAAPLEAYGRLPAIEEVAISPDGRLLAIASTDGDQRTLAIETVADLKIVSLIRVGQTKLRALQWAGPHHVLLTIEVNAALEGNVVLGGVDHWGVIDYNLDTRKQSVLLGKFSQSLNVVGSLPRVRIIDGKPYAFVWGAYDDGGSPTLSSVMFRINLDTGLTTIAEYGLPNSTDGLVSAGGELIAQTTYDAKASIWSLRLKRGAEWRTVKTLTAPIETPELAGLGRDGRSILMADWVDNGQVLREIAPQADDWGPPISKNGDDPIHDGASNALIGVWREDGDTERYTFFNPQDQAIWRAVLAAYPGQSVALAGASADHRKLLVRVDSATDGPAFAIVDLDSGGARWVGAEYAGIGPDDIGEKRSITFKAADGFALNGYVTLPHGWPAKALPLVVLPHGGPAVRDEPGFDWWAQGLASRGYAVLQVNYRGSEGFGWAYQSAGFGQWGRKMQTDLSDGVRDLAAQGLIDPKRVCIVGGSYGGYAALAGATLDHGVYRCAVSVAGVSDPRKMVKTDKADRGDRGRQDERYWLRYLGVDKLDDPALQAISPAAHADAADIPILLIHGVEDSTVNFDQSKAMASALNAKGKPVTLILLKSEDHYLSRGATRLQMLQATVDFLQANNPVK